MASEDLVTFAELQLAHIDCNNQKHWKPGSKFRTIRDSKGKVRLSQSIGSLFPELAALLVET